MNRKRLMSGLLIASLLLLVPTSAFAGKRIFKANLATEEGVKKGAAILGLGPSAATFNVVARSLSGPATAAHIHSAVDASILVTLCDSATPTPGVPLCTSGPSGPNSLLVGGTITPAMYQVGGAVFSGLLNDSMTYVNVHTTLNPGGEVSGTLIPR